jgi:hypothetical protein
MNGHIKSLDGLTLAVHPAFVDAAHYFIESGLPPICQIRRTAGPKRVGNSVERNKTVDGVGSVDGG